MLMANCDLKTAGRQEEIEIKSIIDVSSDDEANEDLSLKIVQKALTRKSHLSVSAVVIGEPIDVESDFSAADSSPSSAFGLCEFEKGSIEMLQKEKRKESINKIAYSMDEKEVADDNEFIEKPGQSEETELVNASGVEIADNMVLRKLLRGPRYFDPPDSGWSTCYKCGEEGHMAVNCTSVEKKKKPCFVCGSFEHGGKKCTKAWNCFICQESGHRAKDCPEKRTNSFGSSKFCLKCGYTGHDLFSCWYDYSHEDLKDIQCYMCKGFGHLCCVNSVDSSPGEVSCYRCGGEGHTGQACSSLHEGTSSGAISSPGICFRCGETGHFSRECSRSYKKNPRQFNGDNTPTSCYKCGEAGHFARDCSSDGKAQRRQLSYSISTRRSHSEKKQRSKTRYTPDVTKEAKRKRYKADERSFKSKQNQIQSWAWKPMESYPTRPKINDWSSPSTPYSNPHRTPQRRTPNSWMSNKSPTFQRPVSAYGNGFGTPRFPDPGWPITVPKWAGRNYYHW